MKPWFQLSTQEVYQQAGSGAEGLKPAEIRTLRNEFGKNVLEEAKQKSKFRILLDQFKDVMIIILLIAAGISFFVGEHTDAFVILAIIIANGWIGFSQENNAKKAVAMLKKMAAQYALVIRDNNHLELEAAELVPGDLIVLEAGDIIPADARLVEVNSFKTEEAALTGESFSVEKNTDPLKEENPSIADQLNMVFKGTIVSNGSAKAIVIATGMRTELGKIAAMLEKGDQKTPLQKRLAVFSKQLAFIVIIICTIVFLAGLQRGEPTLVMFLTALSLAVAALPEALPAVITIALAKGARRMVKQKALVKKLPAVETLGSVTYICTDKTGTLTQNVMTVEKVQAAEGKEDLLHYAMLLNNEVRFSKNNERIGDSTELALVHYALKKGNTKQNADENFPLVAKLPFDSERMRMSTLHEYENKWILFVKGAPVKMTEKLSASYKDQIQYWLDLNREWAAEGLRILFFGYRVFNNKPEIINEEIESDLEFLGIVAMIDPPREEVIEALRQCKSAGIKTVMITGDQPITARAIAERLEMLGNKTGVMTGAELDKLEKEEFKKQVEQVRVYARVSPEQKLNIVKALQENGEFVAMTGDGVNDAPSLKQSDIGVSMGITGTDVSKESSDMILLDDNFATIVKAIKEGRRIYENIRKFILYVLACNLAEILIIFLAPFLNLPVPLLPIHILWINLVTDGLPGLALTAEHAEKNIMRQPPRSPKENLFAGGMIFRILATGILMAAAVLFLQSWASKQGYDVQTQRTMVFTLLCFAQLGNALSVRSVYHSIFNKFLFSNPGMWLTILFTAILQLMIIYLPVAEPIFKTTALAWKEMGALLLTFLFSVSSFEIVKLISIRIRKKNNPAGGN